MPPHIATVLVVEDEALIAFDLEEELTELGYRVVGPAFNVSQGLRHAETGHFDVALLDINLSSGTSAPIAEVLRERKIPFAFLTGYGLAARDHGLPEAPVITKPLRSGELKVLLESLRGTDIAT
ncbi:MAG: response regulator [Alphaproteobacteria bacterium]